MASPFAMIDHVRDLLELRQRWSREARAHVDRAIAKLDLEFETGHGSYEEYLAENTHGRGTRQSRIPIFVQQQLVVPPGGWCSPRALQVYMVLNQSNPCYSLL